MSPSSQSPSSTRISRSVRAISLLPLLAVLILPAILTGCGGGQDEDIVLATVGHTDIKAGYYENRLVRLEENELPRAADGFPMDMSLMEGKKGFLETLINKEIMVQTAENMGLQNDPGIANARKTLTEYEASMVMWDRVISEPAKTISPEELETFYAKMGSSRDCFYVICNFLEDAEAARKMGDEGADWEDVVREFHDGGAAPTGRYEITVPFGRYNPEFENGVFNAEIGGTTVPISSSYGYWVLRVLKENPGKKPPLEEAKAQILDVTWNRKKAHIKEEFKNGVLEKYKMTIDPDALWKCYQGLPAGETLFREGTQDPRKQDELSPLDIATRDMDMLFYSYINLDGEVKEFTLLDYKIHFDKMNVFQRPKDTDLMGGLRNKIEAELGKILLNFEAQDMGLFEDPEVTDKVDLKVEEMMVNKLYSEVVNIEERVTAEELEAFWAEHSHEYVAKENRSGRMVVCQDAELAAEARTKISAGMEWKEILITYGTDRDNKSKSGKLEGVIQSPGEPVSIALFSIQPGELSEPFEMSNGRYGVVLLESVVPERQVEMIEVSEAVGQRIRENRKEVVFLAMMAKWKESIPVTTHEERLADVASWEELTAVDVPENLVPRN
ncbi:MAG: peptidyl-prolyl cis-trans isomerase [Candidatus Krumholzibacteria bacterium]|nr:peptidyl-prolyl cis-trans isomerase [Candidatus Krumholzibacteria bacterium]